MHPTPSRAVQPEPVRLPIGLLAGIAALVAVLLLPLPAELPTAGQRMLAILAFAVVIWITEAVSYEASAIMITALMAFLIGTAPTLADPGTPYGTSAAIGMALSGFSNSALALVAGALFIAAAMTHTGLDKRIALVTLARVGTTTRRALLGEVNAVGLTMLLGFAVSFGFILPINAPQNMVCMGTDTFNARQFAKVGIVITIAGYLLMLLMGATYWRWLGWM